MNGFAVVIALAVVALFAWLLTAVVWRLVRRFGRGPDSTDDEKTREQHPGDGGS